MNINLNHKIFDQTYVWEEKNCEENSQIYLHIPVFTTLWKSGEQAGGGLWLLLWALVTCVMWQETGDTFFFSFCLIKFAHIMRFNVSPMQNLSAFYLKIFGSSVKECIS